MLPLPRFELHRPTTVAHAAQLLAALGPEARVIAGGTDLLPNMKQGLLEPPHLVSLADIEELRGFRLVRDAEGDALVVGAGTRLGQLAESVLVQRVAPALAEAAAAVGGPHHRAMGTLGGNICLDTRCRYFNQTYFWRKSLGFCLKKDGTACHVVVGGQRCVAAASNDSAPALLALGARFSLLSARGERTVDAVDFYTADGIHNTVLEPGEIVTHARVPLVLHRRSAFTKLRRRAAIDFPLLSIAARLDLRGSHGTLVEAAEVVISALGARPRRLRAAADVAPGTPAEGLAERLAKAAFRECKPLTNVDDDTAWRRAMVPVLVKKAVARALGEAPRESDLATSP